MMTQMMTAPMMQGAQNANPDVGFVQTLIAQRSGAVALAKAVLQYGTDAQVKTWANGIVAAASAAGPPDCKRGWTTSRSNRTMI